jgi:hypothetical protein
MTLKQKFRMANMVDNGLTILEKYQVIADDYAIEFADWITVCKRKGRPYDFENITGNGYAFRVVNTEDWVPETPVTVQGLTDLKKPNPLEGAKETIRKQKWPDRMVMKHMYNRMSKGSAKAARHYQKYLGEGVGNHHSGGCHSDLDQLDSQTKWCGTWGSHGPAFCGDGQRPTAHDERSLGIPISRSSQCRGNHLQPQGRFQQTDHSNQS